MARSEEQQKIDRSADIRLTGLTPEQQERRRLHLERWAVLQEKGIRRGKNAPPCGTFGKRA